MLLEMFVGSARPPIDAAGESTTAATIALVGAVRDRVVDDLEAAALLASAGE